MECISLTSFGDILKDYRKQKKKTQRQLADLLGVHYNTISGWERGNNLPGSKSMVLELARHLCLTELQTRHLLETSLVTTSTYWYVPYQRNPFFTGREEVLQMLHRMLDQEHTITLSQSYALSGLGGIGKTQTVIEYAYRYSHEYAAIFWISAETVESIIVSLMTIAEVLHLPARQEQDHHKITTAIMDWLNTHYGWLLIIDNVEDIELVKRWLPVARNGAYLFTTCLPTLGTLAPCLELEPMSLEESVSLLLHRAGLLPLYFSSERPSLDEKAIATELAVAMDNLPLALDQAGAYIEETHCSLSDFLDLFQSHPIEILHERGMHAQHPFSVVRTFTLAFEHLKLKNALAAELLILCCFLAPDTIPERLILEGLSHSSEQWQKIILNPLQLNAMFRDVLSYALIRRHVQTGMLSIHRLVQAILKEQMSRECQQAYSEQALRIINQVFPLNLITREDWTRCEQLLPHALHIIALCKRWEDIAAPEYCSLLAKTARYLSQVAHFAEAELLYRRALNLQERGSQFAYSDLLNELAVLLRIQGRYPEAEAYFQQALLLQEQAPEPDQLQMAFSLHGLATLFGAAGRYREAEPLLQRAFQIRHLMLGAEHSDTMLSLNNLASLYIYQGRYVEAEPLFQRIRQIREQTLEPDIPSARGNLAFLYIKQGRYAEAEPLLQEAIQHLQQVVGPEHPHIGNQMTNLAIVYTHRGRYQEAEAFARRALQIHEKALGPEHPVLAESLSTLGQIFLAQGREEEAESLFQQALRYLDQAQTPDHSDAIDALQGLASLYARQKRYEEAQVLSQRVLHILEQMMGMDHPDTMHARAALVNLSIRAEKE
jgi:tetratricopeptide (TPR) repeat protein/transcriptional regulator with XRE-family HTH domain